MPSLPTLKPAYAGIAKRLADASAERDRRSVLQLDAARQSQARRSLLPFTRYTMPDYQINWHHRIVAERLDAFARGEIRRLMIFMPPRHGKSELVSRRLPAFILGRNPEASIIACSYAADLAQTLNRAVQRIMDSPEYLALFPESRLSRSNVRTAAQENYLRNSDVFEIVGHRGRYKSSGVGGDVMGHGFNFGLIDDPIKNREEADSVTHRRNLIEWYTSTFLTRQADANACILLTVTRWHEADLAGQLLALAQADPQTDQWTVLNFPALAEHGPTDADPRTEGDPLWPAKFPLPFLEAVRATSDRDWSALYQQRPAPATGALFRRDQFTIIGAADVPPGLQWARMWDLAASTRTHADYTASAAVALDSAGTLYIRDMARGRWEWPDQEPRIKAEMAREPNTHHGIEKALHGLAAVQGISRDKTLADVPLLSVDVDTDKYSRALAWANRAVKLVAGPWVEAFLAEVLGFPYGVHDDQVDTVSGGVSLLARYTPKAAAWSSAPEEYPFG